MAINNFNTRDSKKCSFFREYGHFKQICIELQLRDELLAVNCRQLSLLGNSLIKINRC
jgi:hypothetical protein